MGGEKSCRLHYEAAPLKIVRASKQKVWDDKGIEYLDCINLIAHVGHCHPKVVEAGQEQMGRLSTCQGFLTDHLALYAQKLVSTLPEPLSVCFFLNSGSEANDLALRLAKAYTKHEDVIVVDNAYHGNLGNLVDISPRGLKKMGRKPPKYVHVVPVPDKYRGVHRSDEESGRLCETYASYVQRAIVDTHNNNSRVAAFISECIMSISGVIKPPADYFKHVYSYVRSVGGVCIADEVQTGLGRTGHFWSFQHFGVVPDIVTCGKPMGNGHPLAVVVTSRDIANCLHEFASGYGGNPVSCAIGLAVLQVIEDEKLQSSARNVGRFFVDNFRRIQHKHPMMGDVRGEGLMTGVEIVESKASRKPAQQSAELLCYKLKQDGILISNEGPDHNVLLLTPPMCFSIPDAERVVEKVDKYLLEIESSWCPDELTAIGQTPVTQTTELTIPRNILLSDGDGDGIGDDDYGDASKAKRTKQDDDDEYDDDLN